MPKRFLYLIRNGEYNRSSVDTNGDAPLTKRGERQAQLTGVALKDMPIEHIFASPHQQTSETAVFISNQLNDLEIDIRDELRQYDDVAKKRDTKELKLRSIDDDAHEVQIEEVFALFFQPPGDSDSHQIFLCHGNIILDLICRATDVNPSLWSHMLINNAGISIVAIDENEKIELIAFNDVRHLSAELRTE